jgi:hypothetical protein
LRNIIGEITLDLRTTTETSSLLQDSFALVGTRS